MTIESGGGTARHQEREEKRRRGGGGGEEERTKVLGVDSPSYGIGLAWLGLDVSENPNEE